MDPLSLHVPRRRRPRPQLGLACQGNATPASRRSRLPLLAVPFAVNDMSITAVSLAAWLEAPTRNRQRPSIVRSNAPLARLCECGIAEF